MFLTSHVLENKKNSLLLWLYGIEKSHIKDYLTFLRNKIAYIVLVVFKAPCLLVQFLIMLNCLMWLSNAGLSYNCCYFEV